MSKTKALANENMTSRLLFHPSFEMTVKELKKRKIALPNHSTNQEIDFSKYTYPQDGALVSCIEPFGKKCLSAKKGQDSCKSNIICAYDESVNKFEGLEGTAYLTSHSLIIHGLSDYLPVNLLTFYFYTRSSVLSKNSEYIRYSEEADVDSKKDYINDRRKLLTENVPNDAIVFIDGPLIGGNMATATIDLNYNLSSRNITPMCFVKNSNSNMVTDNMPDLKGNFNSDMHWAYRFLKEGERTSLFRYVDGVNPELTKIFCYLKAFNISPQRIEFDIATYTKNVDRIDDLLNLIFYLLLVQGDLKNPQIRSIAIAEKYARASLSLINFDNMMRELGIIPTMNQERFAW